MKKLLLLYYPHDSTRGGIQFSLPTEPVHPFWNRTYHVLGLSSGILLFQPKNWSVLRTPPPPSHSPQFYSPLCGPFAIRLRDLPASPGNPIAVPNLIIELFHRDPSLTQTFPLFPPRFDRFLPVCIRDTSLDLAERFPLSPFFLSPSSRCGLSTLPPFPSPP